MHTTARPIRTDAPVFIVTGASSGIGRALALEAALRQYRVVVCARRRDRLEDLASVIRTFGGTCAIVAGDVSDPQMPRRLVSTAVRLFGRLDAVANVAGMGAPGPLLEQSDAAIEAQWQVHVAAPLRIAREALPHVRATCGNLVFVGSGLARVPAPGFGAYSAVKAAIRAAAIQLRRELRPQGVAVTYVDPGAVQTEFSTAAGMQDRSPATMRVNPELVAHRILRAMRNRSERLNAVPYQTLGVVLGEWFPALAELAMDSLVAAAAPSNSPAPPTPVPTSQAPEPSASPEPSTPTPQPEPGPAPAAQNATAAVPVATAPHESDFSRALAPVARRMERVELPRDFVRSLLVPNIPITLHEAALRWAGMPNKNERAAMHEVLTALTTAGFLQVTGEESWVVLRAAD
jgi:short-subunit dehydrogenase